MFSFPTVSRPKADIVNNRIYLHTPHSSVFDRFAGIFSEKLEERYSQVLQKIRVFLKKISQRLKAYTGLLLIVSRLARPSTPRRLDATLHALRISMLP